MIADVKNEKQILGTLNVSVYAFITFEEVDIMKK